MQNCLINGIASDYISVQNRALHYGDGVFETIACENHKLAFWAAHYQRLQHGAQVLGIDCPEEALWLQDIRSLCARQQQLSANGVVKLILSRGCSERGYLAPATVSPTRIVLFSPGLAPRYFSAVKQDTSKAAALCVCQQTVSINPPLAGIKHLNRLENVLARNEWQQQYTEGLMLDANDRVIEGTMSNIFAFKGASLLTPALNDSGVAGIIRANILCVAEQNRLPVQITDLSLAAIFAMDELFICNSVLELLPVKSLVHGSQSWQSASCEHTEKLHRLIQTIKADDIQQL